MQRVQCVTMRVQSLYLTGDQMPGLLLEISASDLKQAKINGCQGDWCI